MNYQRQLFKGVLQNECSWGIRSTRRKAGGEGGASVFASLFDIVTRLRACKLIAERLGRGCFPADIAKFLRVDFFVEHLVPASELSILQKLCFLNFDTLSFIVWLLILI